MLDHAVEWRIGLFIAAIVCSYGWIALPASWRSFNGAMFGVKLGAFLSAFLVVVAPYPLFSEMAANALALFGFLFFVFPWLLVHAGAQDGKIVHP